MGDFQNLIWWLSNILFDNLTKCPRKKKCLPLPQVWQISARRRLPVNWKKLDGWAWRGCDFSGSGLRHDCSISVFASSNVPDSTVVERFNSIGMDEALRGCRRSFIYECYVIRSTLFYRIAWHCFWWLWSFIKVGGRPPSLHTSGRITFILHYLNSTI